MDLASLVCSPWCVLLEATVTMLVYVWALFFIHKLLLHVKMHGYQICSISCACVVC